LKKAFLTIAKYAISLGGLLFICFIFRDKWPEVLEALKQISVPVFLLAVGIYFLNYCLLALRIQWIMKVQDAHLSWLEFLYWTTVGHFFSMFLPSAVGGDAVKGFYFYKRTGKKTASFVSIFFDRLVGALTILTIAAVAVFIYGGRLEMGGQIKQVLLVMLLAGGVGFTAFFSRRFGKLLSKLAFLLPHAGWRERIAHVYHALHIYRSHRGTLLNIVLVTVLGQVIFITVNYVLAISLGIEAPFLSFFLVIPLVTALSMAPSINGLGVREAGFVYFFGWFMAKEQALALSIAYDVMIFGLGLIYGINYLIREGFKLQDVRQAMAVEHEVEELEAGPGSSPTPSAAKL